MSKYLNETGYLYLTVRSRSEMLQTNEETSELNMDKIYLRAVQFTPSETKLFEGELKRCPFKQGSDLRECVIAGIGCKYGISENVLPAECPVREGTVMIQMSKVKE